MVIEQTKQAVEGMKVDILINYRKIIFFIYLTDFCILFYKMQQIVSLSNIIIKINKIMKFGREKHKSDKNKFKGIQQGSLKSSLLYYLPYSAGHNIFYDDTLKMSVERYLPKFRSELKERLIQIYTWRIKTQFPIVKTYKFQLKAQNQMHVTFDIFNEHCQIRLSEFYEVPFNQILYLMKQSLIGYERLSNKFGIFRITSSMIGINKKNQCKVWISENFQNNIPQYVDRTEKDLVKSIVDIMEHRSVKTHQSKKFFQLANQRLSFLSLIKLIEEFTAMFKIKTPNKFIVSSRDINCNKKQNNKFNPYRTFSPSFKISPKKDVFESRLKSISIAKLLKPIACAEQTKHTSQNKQKNNLKYSNNTANTNTNFEIGKMSISNKFSRIIQDEDDNKKRTIKSQAKEKRQEKKCQVSQSNLNLRRNNSIQQIKETKLRQKNPKTPKKNTSMSKDRNKVTSINKIVEESSKQEEDQEKKNRNNIINSNGWRFQVTNILGINANMKQSLQIGQDYQPKNQTHELSLLVTPGMTVYHSIIPDQCQYRNLSSK